MLKDLTSLMEFITEQKKNIRRDYHYIVIFIIVNLYYNNFLNSIQESA